MAKTDSSTIIDVSQDPALQGVNNTASNNHITVGPLPDNTYLDKNIEIINEPGGNVNEVQLNAGGSFVGDTGLTFNRNTDQLNVKGNLNVGGYIKGKIVTNRFNFFLTGGSNGQVLATDGTGNLRWVNQTGGGGGTNYSNANVASYLPTFTGNLAGGNLLITSGVYTADLSATGTAFLTTLHVNAQSQLGSISNVKITGGSSGQMIATDGTGNLHWATPQPGAQGPQGNPGAAGAAATITLGTVTTGAAGTSVHIVNSGNTHAAIFDFTIPRGDHGETGPKGDTGDTGPAGAQGPQGTPGANGAKGDKGDTGVQGVSGSTGAQGAPGAQGDKGATGDQGVSVTLIGSVPTPSDLPTPGGTGEGYIVSDTGNLWFWNSLTTSWNDIGQIVGPQGDQGPTGATGSQGAQGDQGPAGNDGIDGTSFIWQGEWNNGSYVPYDVVYYLGRSYICTVDNTDTLPTDINYWELLADRGEVGPQGAQGDMGPRGYGVDPGGMTGQVLVKASDNDYDTVWQDPAETSIHIGDSAPSTAINGTVWWSSEAGRSYIKYNDQWVDLSPQIVPPDASNPFDQSLNTTDNVQFNYVTTGNVQANDIDTTHLYAEVANIYSLNVETPIISTGVIANGNVTATGNITADKFIGDGGLLTNIAYPQFDNTIIINDNEPSSAPDGTLWFKSDAGKTYVKYNDQWVDSNPQVIDPTALRLNDDGDLEVPKYAIFKDGRIYQDASDTYTSMRWVNMTPGQNQEMLRVFRDGFNDGFETDERGQLGLVYQSENTSGIYIKSFDGQDDKTWTFEGTGNLELPTGGKIGAIQFPNGVDLYAGANQYYAQLNYDNSQFVWVDDQVVGVQAGGKIWYFDTVGRVIFPDGTIQETAYPGESFAKIPASDFPPSAEEGSVWWNTEQGRAFVKYQGQWIDLSPTTLDATALRLNQDGNLELDNGIIANTISANSIGVGSISTNDLFSGNILSNNVTFGDLTTQTTAYLGPATLLDGGNATANYSGNVPPAGGGGTNPFDQDLNTSDNVTFLNVTANNFNGTATLANSVISVPVGNITGLGNISIINLDGNSSNVLYGNGVWAPAAGGSSFNGNMGGNQLIYDNTRVGQPAINGTNDRISLFPGGVGQYNYGIGIENNYLWLNSGDGSYGIKMYDQGNRMFTFTPSGLTFPDGNTQTTAFTGTANTGFANNSIYNFNGPIIENADLSHGATSALIIPSNGSTSAVQLNNLYGDITISASNSGGAGLKTWRFGSGNIVFPDLSVQNVAWTGNVAAANVTGLGNIATINLDGNSSNVLFGNGVFASAPATYSNTNVAAYLLANPQPGTYSNTNVSSYLTSVGITNYSNTNATSLMASFGSNTISTTGNVTVGNLIAGTDVIATGNVWANSGQFRTTASTAYLVDATPTTVYIAGGATLGTYIGNTSGTTQIYGNVQGNTNGFAIGYRDIPQLSFSGNATLALSDAGKHYYSTLSTANTLIIPNNTSVTFSTGTTINIINQGTGNITIAQGTGVTLYLAGNSTSSNRTLTTYGVASITKVASDTWFISGVGLV